MTGTGENRWGAGSKSTHVATETASTIGTAVGLGALGALGKRYGGELLAGLRDAE